MLTTSILTACVLVHGHDDSLGAVLQGQGELGEPCRTGVSEQYECDSGLRCKKTNHGSYWSGKCVRESNDRGGQGQRCRNGSDPCNEGLEAVRDWVSDPTMEGLEVPRCRCESRLGDSENGDSDNDSPVLGMPAPHTGRLGEPCDDMTCDPGLHCKIDWHDNYSYSTGTCVHNKQEAGGEYQRCRTVQEGSPCNPGLRCEQVRMYPHGHSNICRRDEPVEHPGMEGQRCRTVQEGSPCNHGLRCNRVQLLPSGHRDVCQRDTPHQHTGERDQKCNDSYPKCNHSNLRAEYKPMYPSGQACTCRLNLYGSDQTKLGAGFDDSNESDDDFKPFTFDSFDDFESNDDSNDSDDSTGRLGLAAPHMGNQGEPCRNSWPQCNYGLECSTWTDGSATFGTCERGRTPPAPEPHLGREGQPCRNTYPQCNSGLTCSRWTDGSATFGTCERYGPTPTPPTPSGSCGYQGEKCCGGSTCYGSNQAVTTWENLPGQAFQRPVCRCQPGRLGAAASNDDSNDDSDDDKAKRFPSSRLPKGHGDEGQHCFSAPHAPCKKGLKAVMNDDGDHCKCEKEVQSDSNDSDLGTIYVDSPEMGTIYVDSPKLGMPAPDLGSLGNGCRNGSDGRPPCNYGLQCSRWTDGSATYGTCILDPAPTPTPPTPNPNLGHLGGGCRNGSDGRPACDYGLHCSYWQEGSATMGVCVRNGPSPSPSPAPGSCGNAGQRCCNFGNPCQNGNEPFWSNQFGQAFQTCKCTPRLYTHGQAPSGGY